MKDGKLLEDEQGRPLRRFTVRNSEFADLLTDISADFEVTIVVRPAELASRGIITEVTGADAEAVLEQLAKQCRLQLERLGEKKWRLSAPNSENAAEQTIAYEEEPDSEELDADATGDY
jgi:hypothetical protein